MNYRNPDLLALARLAPHCMGCLRPADGNVVSAHANSNLYGKGLSLKAHDWAVGFCCGHCHAYIDQGRGLKGFPQLLTREELWAVAHRRTLEWLFSSGHLVVAEASRRPPEEVRLKPKRKVPKGPKLRSNPAFPKNDRPIPTRPMRRKA